MANVLSLHDNAAQLEVRIPPVLPLIYKNITEAVVRQTYKIEVDGEMPGTQEVFSFRPTTPWFIRLDTFYIVSADRAAGDSEGKITLSADDEMYAAYFTLEEYYEVRDYLGTLYDLGQVQRIVNLPDYSDSPILSSMTAHFSLFDGFTPLYNVGDQDQLTLYVVSGGNAAQRCQCDLERPLLEHLLQDSSMYDAVYHDGAFLEELKRSCAIDGTEGLTWDEFVNLQLENAYVSSYFPDFTDKKACRYVQGESSDCCVNSHDPNESWEYYGKYLPQPNFSNDFKP